MNDTHEIVFKTLQNLDIQYEVFYHPPTPSVDDALRYWDKINATHCKNLFFRNHKGNRHYLVLFHYLQQLNIRDLELCLKQGKLSFASPERMMRYLGLKPGSVSPFGIINDTNNHVHLFIDNQLLKADKLSFHPNDNTATLVVSIKDFLSFLEKSGNSFEFIQLYD